MRKTLRPFSALQPGELPGDPELGGWRPLVFRSFEPKHESRFTLMQAVQLVAWKARSFTLREALGIVAARVAAHSDSFAA